MHPSRRCSQAPRHKHLRSSLSPECDILVRRLFESHHLRQVVCVVGALPSLTAWISATALCASFTSPWPSPPPDTNSHAEYDRMMSCLSHSTWLIARMARELLLQGITQVFQHTLDAWQGRVWVLVCRQAPTISQLFTNHSPTWRSPRGTAWVEDGPPDALDRPPRLGMVNFTRRRGEPWGNGAGEASPGVKMPGVAGVYWWKTMQAFSSDQVAPAFPLF